ncbi:MAG: integrase, partial [Hyphomicrobiales bacterium]
EPIWLTKPETASRLRGRIERVLEFAKVRGHRSGDNPARWKDGLRSQLPVKSKVRAVKHHSALPYTQVGALMEELRGRTAISARALEFTILTAARTGEVIGARWEEIDFASRTWNVPAERMKAKRVHRVPLTDRALEILGQLPRVDEFVFPGVRAGQPISNMTMAKLLKHLRPGITVHGFRSSFRDWVHEQTAHPREVAEAALGHVVGDKVEAAYRRGDALEKRRLLMQDWQTYILEVSANLLLPRRHP